MRNICVCVVSGGRTLDSTILVQVFVGNIPVGVLCFKLVSHVFLLKDVSSELSASTA